MMGNKPPIRRCAVYTRKSSEEGLEQDFNSLHAQREACEAYTRSQHSEGWRLVDTAYDDGGVSGGSMERPALQRLLGDIVRGTVHIIVVYKVDRLTRSLTDFVKMVELFDRHGASFVAVTQQFNTTTSMGRLTLNILLSFAQFEREIAGERIRDKIAASKRHGMWMGGNLPLGYDFQDHKLVINPEEASLVRRIYVRYMELGSVRSLKAELDRDGVRSKLRVSQAGSRRGGCSFSRGALYTLLANPIYIGEIRHKALRHPGRHEPILDRALWEAVQQRLGTEGLSRRGRPGGEPSSPLIGKLFDKAGERLAPSHAMKKGRRYRYYVSCSLVTGKAGGATHGLRLPALEIERIIATEAAALLADRGAIAAALRGGGIEARHISLVLDAAGAWRSRLERDTEADSVLAALVDRVVIRQDEMVLSLSLGPLLADCRITANAISAPMLVRALPFRMKRRGVERKLIIEGQGARPGKIDPVLLKTITRAHRWFDDLATGREASITALAARDGVARRYITSLLPLAFLAPDIIGAILEGRQPPELTTKTLATRIELPLAWQDQKLALGFR